MKIRLCVTIFAAALGLTQAQAQRLLYDGARDKAAQDGQAAAGKLTSQAVFDAMVKNIASQSATALDVQLRHELESARAAWNSFNNWAWDNSGTGAEDRGPLMPSTGCMPYLAGAPVGSLCRSLRCRLELLKVRLNLDTQAALGQVKAQVEELKRKQGELETELKKLKDQTPDPDLKKLIDERLGQFKEAVEFADSLADVKELATLASAIGSIQQSFDEIGKLFGIAQGIWAGYAAINVDPGDLRPPPAQTALEHLAVDEEALRRIGLIRARTHLMVGVIDKQIAGAELLLKDLNLWDRFEPIEATLRDLQTQAEQSRRRQQNETNPDTPEAQDRLAQETRRQAELRVQLVKILRALHLSSAALSAGDAVVHMGCNQESFERRLAAVQHTAVESHVHELTLKAASDRLALYWKAGIKPSELANLLFNLTTAVTLPVIANK